MTTKGCISSVYSGLHGEYGFCGNEFNYGNGESKVLVCVPCIKLATATEVIRFYGEYDNFSKHPDEEYIVETMGLTLKDAQLGYKARKWLEENE